MMSYLTRSETRFFINYGKIIHKSCWAIVGSIPAKQARGTRWEEGKKDQEKKRGRGIGRVGLAHLLYIYIYIYI
jgi:hypothetical protein